MCIEEKWNTKNQCTIVVHHRSGSNVHRSGSGSWYIHTRSFTRNDMDTNQFDILGILWYNLSSRKEQSQAKQCFAFISTETNKSFTIAITNLTFSNVIYHHKLTVSIELFKSNLCCFSLNWNENWREQISNIFLKVMKWNEIESHKNCSNKTCKINP